MFGFVYILFVSLFTYGEDYGVGDVWVNNVNWYK